jgi:hypothetical protein
VHTSKMTLRARDLVTTAGRDTYRLTELQKNVITQMIKDAKARGEKPNIARIARAAKCNRKSVVLWMDRETTECKWGGGREATVLTPAALKAVGDIVDAKKGWPMSHSDLLANLGKKKTTKMSSSSLSRAKAKLSIKGKRAALKPERAFYAVNKVKRLAAARERLPWTVRQLRRVVWIDESESMRTSARIVHVRANEDGKYERPMIPAADSKEEKVRFIIAFGNGLKFFHALPLKRAVRRNADGTAKIPKGARRRKAKAGNAKLNQANRGETWTSAKLIAVFRKLVPKLQRAFAVVLDNASVHKKLAEYLKQKGVNVVDHPPYSPDMNPAENVIRDLKHDVSKDGLAMTNHEQLARLRAAVRKYKPSRLHAHCDTYPKRMQEVIAREGAPTLY